VKEAHLSYVPKASKRQNDFILSHDLLKDLGLDICYVALQFIWENITVNLVQGGHWTKTDISTVAKSWNKNEK
jgi:hypothetical protein